jgi:hypothetical protein
MVGKKSAKSQGHVLSHKSAVEQLLVLPETCFVPDHGSSVMTKFLLIGAVIGLGAASPSFAGSGVFSGDFSNSNAPAATGGRCAILTVNISDNPPFFASGTSDFGAFTATQSHCLDSGPPLAPGSSAVPYYDGLFTFTFADGKTLGGTYYGELTNSGVAGIVDNVQHFIITGGTGLFADATGSFLGTGQIKFVGGPPVSTLTFSEGVIVAPGVVEPASWAMMLAGFGAIGHAMRSRRKSAVSFA